MIDRDSDLAIAAVYESRPAVSLGTPCTPVAASGPWAWNRSRWTYIFPLRTSSLSIRRECESHRRGRGGLLKLAGEQNTPLPGRRPPDRPASRLRRQFVSG